MSGLIRDQANPLVSPLHSLPYSLPLTLSPSFSPFFSNGNDCDCDTETWLVICPFRGPIFQTFVRYLQGLQVAIFDWNSLVTSCQKILLGIGNVGIFIFIESFEELVCCPKNLSCFRSSVKTCLVKMYLAIAFSTPGLSTTFTSRLRCQDTIAGTCQMMRRSFMLKSLAFSSCYPTCFLVQSGSILSN